MSQQGFALRPMVGIKEDMQRELSGRTISAIKKELKDLLVEVLAASELSRWKNFVTIKFHETGPSWAWVNGFNFEIYYEIMREGDVEPGEIEVSCSGRLNILNAFIRLLKSGEVTFKEAAALFAHEISHIESNDPMLFAVGSLNPTEIKNIEIKRWVRAAYLLETMGYGYESIITLQNKVNAGIWNKIREYIDETGIVKEAIPKAGEIIRAVTKEAEEQGWVSKPEPYPRTSAIELSA